MPNSTPNITFKYSSNEFAKVKQYMSTAYLALLADQFTEEGYKGNSCKYTTMYQYIFVYFLCLYIKKQIALGSTLATVETALGMTTIKNKLDCHNIDIATYYNIFGIS